MYCILFEATVIGKEELGLSVFRVFIFSRSLIHDAIGLRKNGDVIREWRPFFFRYLTKQENETILPVESVSPSIG